MSVFPIEQTPLTISGLTLWFDAFITPTGSISSWLDQSGNKYNATQGTGANQPICTANQIAGKNALLFDGTNDTFVLPSGTYSLANGDNTSFAVAKSNASSDQRIFTFEESLSSRFRISITAASTYGFLNNSASSGGVTIGGVTLSNANIITGRHNGSTLAISINNGVETTNSNGANENGITAGYIGSLSGVQSFFNGALAEILVYNRSLSAAEMLSINKYLSNKWGIST